MAKYIIEAIEIIAAIITYSEFCWHLADKLFKIVKGHFHKQK